MIDSNDWLRNFLCDKPNKNDLFEYKQDKRIFTKNFIGLYENLQ